MQLGIYELPLFFITKVVEFHHELDMSLRGKTHIGYDFDI
jgi:hypothetical protein